MKLNSLTHSFIFKVNEKLRKLFAFFVCKHWIQQLSNNSKIGASKITKTVDFIQKTSKTFSKEGKHFAH